MFKPLAYTKTFAMAASSILAITIIPVLMTFFVRENPSIRKRAEKNESSSGSRDHGPPLLVIAAGCGGP